MGRRALPGSTLPVEGAVGLSADGRLAVVGDAGGRLVTFDLRTGDAIGPAIAAHGGDVMAVALSPHGRRAASAGCRHRGPTYPCADAEIAVWDTRTGRNIARGAIGAAGEVTRVALSPDGSTVAAIVRNQENESHLILWDGQPHERSPTPLRIDESNPLSLPSDVALDVAFSPDGELLAVASSYCMEALADAAGGPQQRAHCGTWRRPSQVGQPLLGHESRVTAVAFSHDGALLASGDSTGEIRLWDVASRAAVRRADRDRRERRRVAVQPRRHDAGVRR